MIPLETRKKHTRIFINKTKKFLFNFTKNDALSGWIVYLVHFTSGLSLLMYLLMGKVNIYFYIVIVMAIMVAITNMYFRGCILTRMERDLWKTKKWWGPTTPIALILDRFNIPVTRNLMNNITICICILITIYVTLKVAYYIE